MNTMKSKALIHGNWIYNNDDGWHLAVYPIVTMMGIQGGEPIYPSFVLAGESNIPAFGLPDCAIQQVLNSGGEPTATLTLYNLGLVEDDEHAEEIELYLVCPVADMTHTPTHSSITAEGYMYVEELGITEDDELLDRQIFDALERLEAPHSITCSPKG